MRGMSMRPEQIPYGVKDFKRIRLEGRYYVDKTAYIRKLEARAAGVRGGPGAAGARGRDAGPLHLLRVPGPRPRAP